jgi:hypothetical protein
MSYFLSNLKYVAHLKGFYSHLTILVRLFPVQKFWLLSLPLRTHLPLHISHIFRTIFYEVPYERISLSRSTKHHDLTVYWSTLDTHHLLYLEQYFSQSTSSRQIQTDLIHFQLVVSFVIHKFITFLASSHRLNHGFRSTLRLRFYIREFSLIIVDRSTSHHQGIFGRSFHVLPSYLF